MCIENLFFFNKMYKLYKKITNVNTKGIKIR